MRVATHPWKYDYVYLTWRDLFRLALGRILQDGGIRVQRL